MSYVTIPIRHEVDMWPRELKAFERLVYHVNLQNDEGGWIVARCLEFPEAISQGKTQEEAVRNIMEAIELVLEEKGSPLPQFSITLEK